MPTGEVHIFTVGEFMVGQTHVTITGKTLAGVPAGARIVGNSPAWNHKLELEQMTVTQGDREEDVIGCGGGAVGFEWLSSSGWPCPAIAPLSDIMFRVRYADAWPPQRPGVTFELFIITANGALITWS